MEKEGVRARPRDQLRDAPQPDQDLDEVWSAASDDRDPFSLVDSQPRR